MKQRTLSVNRPWVKSEPEPIILPFSSLTCSTSSFHDDVTVELPVTSRLRSCDECCMPSDRHDVFCGYCGNSLKEVRSEQRSIGGYIL